MPPKHTYVRGSSHWFAPSHPTSHPYPLAPPASPLLFIVFLWPHPSACPVTIDIHGCAPIGLRSLKNSCLFRSLLQRIWRASGYTGEHLVHMHPVNVWFLGEGFPSSADGETSGNTSRGLIPSLTILVQCRFITFESNMLMFTGFEHDFILVYILYWSAYVCLYAELDYICTIYERKQN